MTSVVRRPARRFTVLGVLCGAVVCLLLSALVGPAAHTASRPTVAVLPDLRADADPEARAPGTVVLRLITDQFAALGEVRVVDYTTATNAATRAKKDLAGRGRGEALRRIGVDLGADLVVIVSATAERGRWRVRSNICDVPSGQVRNGPGGTVRLDRLWPLLASITETTVKRAGIELTATQLRRARYVPTTDETALLALGYALSTLPGAPAAEGKLLDAVRRDPDFVEAHMELGRLYFGRQDYELAADAYEQARLLRPGHPYVDYNLGLTYRALGAYARAIDAYERARLADDSDADVVNNLGIAYYLDGDLARARETFRQALALAPYNRRVRANLRAVEDALQAPLLAPEPNAAGPADATPPTSPHLPPEPAVAAAPEAPSPATSAPPGVRPTGDPQVYLDTATISFARGDYERAMVDYEKAVEEEPDNPRVIMQLGRTYRRLARHADAVATFSRVLELDPDNADAADLLDQSLAALRLGRTDPGRDLAATRTGMNEADLAQTYYRKGKRHFIRNEYADAVAAYTRALQFTPRDVMILNSLGVAQYERGKVAEAKQAFTRALALSTDDGSAQMNLDALAGLERHERVRAAEDEEVYTLLRVEVDPALEPEVAYLDGNTAFAAGDFAAAATAYERAVALNPDHGRAWNNLGAARVRLDEYDGALQAFARAATLMPSDVVRDNRERARLLARYTESGTEARDLLVALEADAALDFRYRMALAREAYDRGDYAAAADAYQALAAVHTDEAMPLNNLAATYYMLKRYDDAYAAIELALRRAPADEATQANRDLIAEARYVTQVARAGREEPLRVPDATIVVKYSTEQAESSGAPPSAPPARAPKAARAQAPRRDPADVEATFRRVLQERPDDLDALRGLAGVLASEGRWTAAADGYRRTAERAPDDFLVAMAWGYAALRADRAAEARRAFRQASEARPDSARARYNWAIAERRAGNVEAAIVACRAALELEPGFADARYNLANLYLEAGRWDEAIEAFRQVLQLDEGNVSAYNNLAIAHWRRGEIDTALGMWRTALALDPGCTFAADNLNRFTKLAATAGRT